MKAAKAPFVTIDALQVPPRHADQKGHDEALVGVYRQALKQSLPPRQVLIDRLGVSARTVDGWLASLRRRDLLQSYDVERQKYGPSREVITPATRRQGDPPPHPRYVAEDYRRAKEKHGGGSLRAALAEQWGVSVPTVDRWLREARDTGHLSDNTEKSSTDNRKQDSEPSSGL